MRKGATLQHPAALFELSREEGVPTYVPPTASRAAHRLHRQIQQTWI